MPLTFGSLFAGIGGMDLGLERAGMECKWQVEIDEFCQSVLAKHWPDVERHRDITKLKSLPHVDLIAGGFPCQDVSNAGEKEGITGKRSGLWAHFARLIRVVRPRLVLVENVSGLLERGMGRVLGDLAESGFDVQWDCVPAAAAGASHIRQRVFLVAYSRCERRKQGPGIFEAIPEAKEPNTRSGRIEVPLWDNGFMETSHFGVANGIPNRMDRLKSLGNAVVPQVAEWIGKRIIEVHDK